MVRMTRARYAPAGNSRANRPLDIYEITIAGGVDFRYISRVVRRNPDNGRDLVQHEGKWRDLHTAAEMLLVVRGALEMGHFVFSSGGDYWNCERPDADLGHIAVLPFVCASEFERELPAFLAAARRALASSPSEITRLRKVLSRR